MFIVSILLSLTPFWTIGIRIHNREDKCLLFKETLESYQLWLFIVFGLGELLVPSIIVSLFTVIIIYKLSKASAERSRAVEGQRSSNQKRSSKESQPTKALVSIASTFVLLRLPYIITFYINEYKEELWPDMTKLQSFHIYTAYSLTFVFSTLNYAISFLLFCVTGNTFRKELRKCFLSCCGRGVPPGSPYASTYSTSATAVKYNAIKCDSPRTKPPPDIIIFKPGNSEARYV